jgi:membrane-associated protease RseP (regulator of RpoE activity)
LDPLGAPPRASADSRFDEDLRAYRQSLYGPSSPPRPSLRSAWFNVLLFALTAGSIYLRGGPRMTLAVLSILLAHEMGHYVMCRRYRVDATLPFFIPLPFSLAGTLGAFIRMKAPIPDRRALMDIGVTGPLAGFVVCLPVLVIGVLEATIGPREFGPETLALGEPLLFQWATYWLRGPIPDGREMFIGPVGLAAWFGLFVTALNLMPIGQLDGGHVAYAMLRRHHRAVSYAALAACLLLLFLRPTWLLWTILLLALGRRHPPTLDDTRPLGAARVALGILGFVVFAVCFTPNPFLITWSDFFDAWRTLFSLIFTSR